MKIFTCGTLLLTLTLNLASAKHTVQTNTPIKSTYKEEISINTNGTYERIRDIKREILTEPGKNRMSNFILHYDKDSEKIEILSAKTIYKGKEYLLNKNLIIEKPLTILRYYRDDSEQQKQILLKFPKVEIGSTICLKYKFIQKKPMLDNFFAETFSFGDGEFTTDSHIKIKSKMSLRYVINDPEHYLKTTTRKTGNGYRLDIALIKPIYKTLDDRPQLVNDKHLTWVLVSNIYKQEEPTREYEYLTQKEIAQELPENLKKVLAEARQKSDTEQQKDLLTLIGNIKNHKDHNNYMLYIPQNLNIISNSRFAGCASNFVAGAAVFIRLNYTVQIAEIRRGIDQLSEYTLPNFCCASNYQSIKYAKRSTIYNSYFIAKQQDTTSLS